MTDPPEFAEELAHLRRCLELLFKESGDLWQKVLTTRTNVEIKDDIFAFHTAILEARADIMDACDDLED
jgi:hypothetical protein